jgi:hypothetical protein
MVLAMQRRHTDLVELEQPNPLRRLTIDLEGQTFRRLATVADQERRDPRRQAVVLIERGLEMADQHPEPASAA